MTFLRGQIARHIVECCYAESKCWVKLQFQFNVFLLLTHRRITIGYMTETWVAYITVCFNTQGFTLNKVTSGDRFIQFVNKKGTFKMISSWINNQTQHLSIALKNKK